MKKQDLIKLRDDVKRILDKNDITDKEIATLEKAKKLNCYPIDKEFKDNYDRRATHSGFGAENCSCHIMPPCQACVDLPTEENS